MSEDAGGVPAGLSGGEAKAQLKELLDTTWRISLKDDDRVFTGKFMVVDRQCNVVLDETTEEREGRTRNVGLIMIPGNNIKTAEVDRDTLVM